MPPFSWLWEQPGRRWPSAGLTSPPWPPATQPLTSPRPAVPTALAVRMGPAAAAPRRKPRVAPTDPAVRTAPAAVSPSRRPPRRPAVPTERAARTALAAVPPTRNRASNPHDPPAGPQSYWRVLSLCCTACLCEPGRTLQRLSQASEVHRTRDLDGTQPRRVFSKELDIE